MPFAAFPVNLVSLENGGHSYGPYWSIGFHHDFPASSCYCIDQPNKAVPIFFNSFISYPRIRLHSMYAQVVFHRPFWSGGQQCSFGQVTDSTRPHSLLAAGKKLTKHLTNWANFALETRTFPYDADESCPHSIGRVFQKPGTLVMK